MWEEFAILATIKPADQQVLQSHYDRWQMRITLQMRITYIAAQDNLAMLRVVFSSLLCHPKTLWCVVFIACLHGSHVPYVM